MGMPRDDKKVEKLEHRALFGLISVVAGVLIKWGTWVTTSIYELKEDQVATKARNKLAGAPAPGGEPKLAYPGFGLPPIQLPPAAHPIEVHEPKDHQSQVPKGNSNSRPN